MDPSNPTCECSHRERAQQIRARSVGCLGPGGFSGTPAASEVRHPAGQEVCLRWNAETRLAGRGSGRDLGPSPEAGACRLLLRCCGPVCPLLPPSTPPGTAPGSQRQLPRCGEAGIDALLSRRDQEPSGGVSHFCASRRVRRGLSLAGAQLSHADGRSPCVSLCLGPRSPCRLCGFWWRDF